MNKNKSKNDLARAVSRHTVSYILCSISELLRHYDFDVLDLLIVHAILNGNVRDIMRDRDLDRKFAGIEQVEPSSSKQGISRSGLSRFLNLPLETVRRRVERLMKKGALEERPDGLVVSDTNSYKFGNNHELQQINLVLVRKLLKDLASLGIRDPQDI